MSANTEFERLDLVEKQKLEKLLSLIDLDSDLLTIAINEPADGQVLTYDGTASKWKNSDASGGGDSFVVTITEDSGMYSADKTLAEINDALEDGLLPIAILDADGFHNVYHYSFGDSTRVALFNQINPTYNESMEPSGFELKTLGITAEVVDITNTYYIGTL